MDDQIVARIRRRLQERGLDAYIAYTPSNVFYASGFQSYFLMEWWRWQGSVLVVIPADERQAVGMVVGDFEAAGARATGVDDVRSYALWVELRDAEALRGPRGPEDPAHRPAQFDPDEQDRVVRGLLMDRGLGQGRIGTDLRYILHSSLVRLQRSLPQAEWTDFTDDMYELRSIKLPFEVERLRRATELSEAGMSFAASEPRPGMTAGEVRHRYTMGILRAAAGEERYAGYTDNWILPAVGSGVGIGVGSEYGTGLAAGDLIKFDCGVTFGGYRSDGGRTFAFDRVVPKAEHLYETLREAQALAREAIRPGVAVSEVFQIAQRHVQDNGYPRYTRGHVGHSIGIDTFHEEPPYLSADEHRLIEAGMVLAVEVPAYSSDVGAVMIEDLVHVTAEGTESLHRLPRSLEVVA